MTRKRCQEPFSTPPTKRSWWNYLKQCDLRGFPARESVGSYSEQNNPEFGEKETMRYILTILVIVGFWFQSALGSEEYIVPPYQISIAADAVKPFGEVIVHIDTNKDQTKPKIVSIRLRIHGKWLSVPEKAFADLDTPLLSAAEIRTEVGYDESPWLYIYFELAYRDQSGKWNPKKEHIAYHREKF